MLALRPVLHLPRAGITCLFRTFFNPRVFRELGVSAYSHRTIDTSTHGREISSVRCGRCVCCSLPIRNPTFLAIPQCKFWTPFPFRSHSLTRPHIEFRIWGTTVNVEATKEQFQKFLREYQTDSGDVKYRRLTEQMGDTDEWFVELDCEDLRDFEMSLYDQLVSYPQVRKTPSVTYSASLGSCVTVRFCAWRILSWDHWRSISSTTSSKLYTLLLMLKTVDPTFQPCWICFDESAQSRTLV